MPPANVTPLSIHCPGAEPPDGKQGIKRIAVGLPGSGASDPDREKHLIVTYYEAPGLSLCQADAYRITGGHRLFPRVIDAKPYSTAEPQVKLTLDQVGDFSVYTLTARGVDPPFDSRTFRFRLGCDEPFDCAPSPATPSPAPDPRVAIDYLTKDYAGFRQALLEFIPTRLPAWTERSEADIGMMLLELFAATADTLSYVQDRVANEAFLDSALERRSVAGHLALIGYEMDQGAAAYTWLQFQVAQTMTIPKGLAISNKPAGAAEQILVFETQTTATLRPDHNEIPVFSWSQGDCCLPSDALSLILAGSYPNLVPGEYVLLDDGAGQCDVVKITRTSTLGGNTTIEWDKTTPLNHGYCVRAFDMCQHNGWLTAVNPDLKKVTIKEITYPALKNPPPGTHETLPVRHGAEITLDGKDAGLPELQKAVAYALATTQAAGLFVQYTLDRCATHVQSLRAQNSPRLVVRGNLAPVTHGETVTEELSDPDKVPTDSTEVQEILDRGFRLQHAPLAYLNPNTPELDAPQSAASPLSVGPPRGISTLNLTVGDVQWHEKPSLLKSGTYDPDYRVEIDDAGYATIRFGALKSGPRPPDLKKIITATYRVGGGTIGNVGADTLRQLVKPMPGIVAMTNPLPAIGGRDLESRDHARRFGPAGFKTPRVCLTAADYQAAAESFTNSDGTKPLQRASASFRWTGSWLTVSLWPDPIGGDSLESDVCKQLLAFLNGRRLAGYDVEVNRSPQYFALDLAVTVCMLPGFHPADVEQGIAAALGSGVLPDGRKGLFHHENFTFGQSLYVSRIYSAVADAPGVESGSITRLCRFRIGDPAAQTKANLKNGFVAVGPDQIIRLDNDRNFPEHGVLSVQAISRGRP